MFSSPQLPLPQATLPVFLPGYFLSFRTRTQAPAVQTACLFRPPPSLNNLGQPWSHRRSFPKQATDFRVMGVAFGVPSPCHEDGKSTRQRIH